MERMTKTNEQYIDECSKLSNITPLEKYKGALTKILHRNTKCGHEWSCTPNSILKGTNCPTCSKNRKITLEEYKKYAADRGFAITDYKSTKVKLRHTHVCGYVWEVAPEKIRMGRSCPGCSTRAKSTNVYLIYFPSLELYKVGMSSDVNRRISKLGIPCNLIWIESYATEEEARLREKEVLSKVELFDTGLLKDGNTETFII